MEENHEGVTDNKNQNFTSGALGAHLYLTGPPKEECVDRLTLTLLSILPETDVTSAN